MSQIEAFLRDIDGRWVLRSEGVVTLKVLGSTALMLQTDYARGTKDGDILETTQITPVVGAALLALAGKESLLAQRHRMYLEILGAAFPFLPVGPVWHPVSSFAPPLQHFNVEVLDVVDVVVAKLARFHGADRDDIAAMAARDLVDPDRFVARFRSAVATWAMVSRADDLPRIVRNFHRVQRDELFVDASPVELPGWVSEG